MAWSPATRKRSWTDGSATTTGSLTRAPPNSRPRWAGSRPTPPSPPAAWAWPGEPYDLERRAGRALQSAARAPAYADGATVPAAAHPVPQGAPARARRGDDRRAVRRGRLRRAHPCAEAGGLGAALGPARRGLRGSRGRSGPDPRPDGAEPGEAGHPFGMDGP